MDHKWPTLVSPSRGLAMCATPQLLLVSFTGHVTWTEYEALLRRAYDRAVLGERYLFLNRIAVAGVQEMPDDEFRRNVAEILEQRRDEIAGFAHLVEGRGFIPSIVQAVITGISVVRPPGYPMWSLSDPRRAADWLSWQLPGGPSPADILARLDEFVREQDRGR